MTHHDDTSKLGAFYLRLDLARQKAERAGKLVEVLEVEETIGVVREALAATSPIAPSSHRRQARPGYDLHDGHP